MDEFDRVRPLVDACLLNAERLLNVARDAYKPGQNHIAYHLAALALEEVGKASIFTVNAIHDSRVAMGLEDKDEKRPAEWIEDHERKLFWALWLPNFGSRTMSVEEFRSFQELARKIHGLRLATLYVGPESLGIEVTDQEVKSLIDLTEARLEMERANGRRAPEPEVQADLDWFFRASEHPFLKTVVFSRVSLDKLAELDGDSRKWVRWMRETVEEMNRMNRELAETELKRVAPGEAEARQPRWEITLRFKSSSHSIRPKHLAKWNDNVDSVKLYPTADKKELLVKLTLQKGILVNALWNAGFHLSTLLAVSFNIGALGFFWWYLPSVTTKYYDKILDLENNANLVLDTPSLEMNFGHRALKEADLINVSLVLGYLLRLSPEQFLPYGRYFRALGVLAKNDLLGQFHQPLMIELSEAMKAAFIAHGDWDGKPETFDAALDMAFGSFGSDFLTEVKGTLQLAKESGEKQTSASIDAVLKMKTFCDTYFLTRIRDRVKKEMESQQSVAGA
jgi:AbiV family abortive infection protein